MSAATLHEQYLAHGPDGTQIGVANLLSYAIDFKHGVHVRHRCDALSPGICYAIDLSCRCHSAATVRLCFLILVWLHRPQAADPAKCIGLDRKLPVLRDVEVQQLAQQKGQSKQLRIQDSSKT